MGIGTSVNAQLDTQEWPSFRSIFLYRLCKICRKMSTLKKEELLLLNLKNFISLLLISLTLVRSLIACNIESMITINASKTIAMISRKRKQLSSAEILMFATKRSTLQDQKVTKKLQGLQFRKEKASPNSWIMVGSILLGSFIQIQ